MTAFLDKLAAVRGAPVLIGVGLVLANFVVRSILFAILPEPQAPSFFLFLFTDGNLLLHLGIVAGLLGILIGDVL
jgi:hypothetical protein